VPTVHVGRRHGLDDRSQVVFAYHVVVIDESDELTATGPQ
jgi:hypothetical protein